MSRVTKNIEKLKEITGLNNSTKKDLIFELRKKLSDKENIINKPKPLKKHPKNFKKYFTRKEYQLFLKSKYWKSVRKTILKRDKKQCNCGSKVNLQVHHLTYENHLSEHKHLEDLITLCESCHKKVHDIK